jgi:hypothetical protein
MMCTVKRTLAIAGMIPSESAILLQCTTKIPNSASLSAGSDVHSLIEKKWRSLVPTTTNFAYPRGSISLTPITTVLSVGSSSSEPVGF